MNCRADSISSSEAIESQQENGSRLLAIGLPLVLFAFYIFVMGHPWPETSLNGEGNVEEPAQLRKQCTALIDAGKYQAALPCVLKLEDAYPGNHIYIELTAQVYHHLRNYTKEAELWEKYLDRAPVPVTACPMIGQAYWAQGKQKEAIAAFERCLTYDPENSDSLFFLAHALEMSGQSDRAGELYDRGAKLAPDYTDLQLGKARFLLRHGRNAEALRIALASLKKAPKNTDALLVAGLACEREQQLSQAREYLTRGVNISSTDADFHFALARLDEQSRDFGDALGEYEKILTVDPGNALARSRRDVLREKR